MKKGGTAMKVMMMRAGTKEGTSHCDDGSVAEDCIHKSSCFWSALCMYVAGTVKEQMEPNRFVANSNSRSLSPNYSDADLRKFEQTASPFALQAHYHSDVAKFRLICILEREQMLDRSFISPV